MKGLMRRKVCGYDHSLDLNAFVKMLKNGAARVRIDPRAKFALALEVAHRTRCLNGQLPKELVMLDQRSFSSHDYD
jgi:hypothetical protein